MLIVKTINGENHYYADYEERYCLSCDEYVMSSIEVDAWTVDGDGEPCEPDYDDSIGKPFCPMCETEVLYDNQREAIEAARENYEADRADAIRKGEW